MLESDLEIILAKEDLGLVIGVIQIYRAQSFDCMWMSG